jgi:hypothetical protein
MADLLTKPRQHMYISMAVIIVMWRDKISTCILPCESDTDNVGTHGGDMGQACGCATCTRIVLRAVVEDTPGGGVHAPKWS